MTAPAYPNPCPYCGAAPGAPCRTASGRVTDTHADRIRRPLPANRPDHTPDPNRPTHELDGRTRP